MRPLPIVAAFALPARRHTFLLGPAGTQRVLALVCRMLEDAKLEVREMAATTLSGTVPLPPPGPPPPAPPAVPLALPALGPPVIRLGVERRPVNVWLPAGR